MATSFVSGGGIQSKSISDFDPRTVSGCVLWLDAADSNTLFTDTAGTIPAGDGDLVARWNDKTNPGKRVLQDTSARRPAYVRSSNSLPVVNFTGIGGSTQYFDFSPDASGVMPVGTNPATYMIVAKANVSASSSGNIVISYGTHGASNTQRTIGLFGTPNNLSRFSVGTSGSDVSTSVLQTTIQSIAYSNFTISNSVNGNTPLITDVQSLNPITGTSNYSIGDYLLGGSPFYGSISEILVFNRALQNDERQQVEGYLAWKWGLVQNLPTTHPYQYSKAPQTSFQPTNFPSCRLWLDAADSNSVVQSVSQWRDKSGNGRHFVAAGASPTPRYSNTAFLGSPGLQFTRTSNSSRSVLEWTNNATPLTTSDITVMMLVRRNAQNTSTVVGISGVSIINDPSSNKNDSFAFMSNLGGNHVLRRNNNGVTGPVVEGIDNDQNQLEIISFTINRSTLKSAIRKTTSAETRAGERSGEVNSDLILKQIRLGTSTDLQNNNSDGGQFTFEGVISEVLIYNNVLSSTQLNVLEGYIAWKYKLASIILPSTHPYRTSSPGEFRPTSISGCQLWLDAADSASVVPANVTQWNDKSGNANNAAQSTVANQPTYLNNGVYFGTSGTPFMNITNLDLLRNVPYAGMFIVSRIQSAQTQNSNRGTAFSSTIGGSASPRFAVTLSDASNALNPGTLARQLDGDSLYALDSTTATTLNTTNILFGQVNYTGRTITNVLNGNQINTSTNQFTGSNNTSNTASQSITINSNGATNRLNDTFFYEILLYTTSLTSAQREQVEGYLAWKWGLQQNLPATHPFTQANYFFNNTRPFSRTFSPTDIEGCQLWIDAADETTIVLTSSRVTEVKDKSGLGNNISNSSSVLRYTDKINGLNTITCPGGAVSTTNNLSTVDLPRDQFNHSYFVVVKYPSSNSAATRYIQMTNHFFGHTTQGTDNSTPSNVQIYLEDSNSIVNSDTQYTFHSGTYATRSGALSGNTFICAGIRQNSIYTLAYNGVPPTGNTNSAGTAIGSAVGNSASTAYILRPPENSGANVGGQLAEVIIYNRGLTRPERQIVEGYLAQKWGVANGITQVLTGNAFPASHPYASYPPVTAPIPPSAKLYKKTFDPADLSPLLWFDPQDSTTYLPDANNRLTSWTSKGSNNLALTTIGEGATLINGPLITTSATRGVSTTVSQGTGFQFADFSSGGYFRITAARLSTTTNVELTLTPNHNIPQGRQVTFSQLGGNTPGGTLLTNTLTNGSYIVASVTPNTINIQVPTQGSTGTFTQSFGRQPASGAVEYGNISMTSTASVTTTTLTINTTQPHGLSASPADTVTLNFTAGTLPSLAAATTLNGTYTVASVPNSTQITITIASQGSTGPLTGSPTGVVIFPSTGCGLNWSGTPISISTGGTLVCVTHLPRTPVRNGPVIPGVVSTASTNGGIAGSDSIAFGRDFRLAMGSAGLYIRKNSTLTGIVNTQLTSGFNVMNMTLSNTAVSGADIPTGRNGLAVKGWRYDTAFSNTNYNSISPVAATSSLLFAQIRVGGNTEATSSSPINSHWYEGGLGDIFFFDRVLRLEERQLLEGWLSQKYGCNNTLGSTSINTGGAGVGSSIHPYRLNPTNISSSNTLATPITSPSQISNSLAAWFDATYTPSLSTSTTSYTNTSIAENTAIASWGSRGGSLSQSISGAGWVAQTIPERQPRYITNSVNGLPGLRFSGTSGSESAFDNPSNSGRLERMAVTQDANPNTTIIAVVRPTTASNGIILTVNQTADGDSYGLKLGINSSRTVYFSIYNNSTLQSIASSALTLNQPYIIVARRRGTNMLIRIIGNGTTTPDESTVANLSIIGSGGAYLRIGNTYADGSNPFLGDINEFMIFRQALTDQAIQQVEGYLAWKWGLQGSLPDTHAYKKVAA